MPTSGDNFDEVGGFWLLYSDCMGLKANHQLTLAGHTFIHRNRVPLAVCSAQSAYGLTSHGTCARNAFCCVAVIDAYMENAKKRRVGLSSKSTKKKKSQTDDFIHQKMV